MRQGGHRLGDVVGIDLFEGDGGILQDLCRSVYGTSVCESLIVASGSVPLAGRAQIDVPGSEQGGELDRPLCLTARSTVSSTCMSTRTSFPASAVLVTVPTCTPAT